MRKIPSLFQRSDAAQGKQSLCVDRVTPGCEWALDPNEQVTISRKWDGTACLVMNGHLYARYDAKEGKPAPKDGIPCQEPDPVTGHWPHWVPARRPEDRYIREAFENVRPVPDGTYEALGPKINGNNEGLLTHILVRHGEAIANHIADLSFEGVRQTLVFYPWEGLVFRHADGRKCKAKRKDFGITWPLRGQS